MNDLLRDAMFRAGLTEEDVAGSLAVDPKTVLRWLEGRLPYRRHRWEVARLLGVQEIRLWPQLRAIQGVTSKPDEIAAVYPHRSSVTHEGWKDLLTSATQGIDILVYAGLFLVEDRELLDILIEKAHAQVPLRIGLGDPASPHVAERGQEEQIGEAVASKVRNALVLYRPLSSYKAVEIRLHRTTLYNSIYRADDDMLVNQHAYGIPAGYAPTYHLRRTERGEMFQCYVDSFERVWTHATPIVRERSATQTGMATRAVEGVASHK